MVLLTVLEFFNSVVWAIAAHLGASRMMLLMGFLALIAMGFLVSGISDHLPTAGTSAAHEGLADTPFAVMSPAADSGPLRCTERANLPLVATISQVIQMAILYRKGFRGPLPAEIKVAIAARHRYRAIAS
ncbi:hypothetical protein [Mycolicibacterium sp. A43C]